MSSKAGSGSGSDRGGGGQRDRGLVAVVDFAAIFHAPQPAFQLGDRGLEGGIETVGAGFATDHRPATASGDLDVLAGLALATVALVVEFDIEQVDGSVESLQAGEFLRDVDAEVVGDFDVAAFDDDLGGCRSVRRSSTSTGRSASSCPESTVCLDILDNSFLSHCAQMARPAIRYTRRRGCQNSMAARRCKVSKIHPLPSTVAPRVCDQMRCLEALWCLIPTVDRRRAAVPAFRATCCEFFIKRLTPQLAPAQPTPAPRPPAAPGPTRGRSRRW